MKSYQRTWYEILVDSNKNEDNDVTENICWQIIEDDSGDTDELIQILAKEILRMMN